MRYPPRAADKVWWVAGFAHPLQPRPCKGVSFRRRAACCPNSLLHPTPPLTPTCSRYCGAGNPAPKCAPTRPPWPRASSTPNAPLRPPSARIPGKFHRTSSNRRQHTAYLAVLAMACSLAPHLAGPTSSLSQPSCPSASSVAMFFSKMSDASGNASTAFSILSSRSKCRVG
jgi:hypothetical protein